MVTLDLKLLLLSLLILAAIVLLVFLTIAVANTIKMMKNVNGIISDVKVLTDITAKRGQQVDGVVDDVVETVKETNFKIRGNKNIVKAASAVGSLIIALRNIAAAASKEKEAEAEQAEAQAEQAEAKAEQAETEAKQETEASGGSPDA
jgi:ABC-type transporter Mla subunit MlaD